MKEGVYIGIGDGDYFGAEALGSTDLARLYEYREGWWWQSRYNPNATPRATRAMGFGTALHALLLEGQTALEDRYFVKPAKEDYGPELIVSKEDIMSALDAIGAPTVAKGAKKQAWLDLARVYLKHRDVWDFIEADAIMANKGKAALTRQEYIDLQMIRETALEIPEIEAILEPPADWPRMVEVAVFFEVKLDPDTKPILCRFKFDGLFPQMTVDLKTVSNGWGDFDAAIASKITEWPNRLQAGWSYYARAQMYRLIREMKVFGGDLAEHRWIAKFPEKAPLENVQWTWLFAQRPMNSGIPPVVSPVILRPGSRILQEGHWAAVEALRFYADKVASVGLDQPWKASRPPREAIDTDEQGETYLATRKPRKVPAEAQTPEYLKGSTSE